MSQTNVLKLARESAMFSQLDLATLLDVSQARISRYESGEENPPLPTVLAYYAVFGRPPHTMFPDLFASIEEGVMGRGAELETALRDRHDRASVKKRALLERMMSRACNRAGA